jgi:MFS family permease
MPPVLPTSAIVGHGGDAVPIPVMEEESERRFAPGRLAAAGARPVGWVASRLGPPERSLLREEAFRSWWLTRFFCQVAQGALLYALLIIVVDRTDNAIYASLFVACSIVPSLLFGLLGGIVGDSLPKRPLLVGLNLVRFLFLLVLVVRDVSLAGIFAATLGIWTIHQFYSPVESTSLTALVPRSRLAEAQSLSNLSLTLSQGVGLVILAPLLLKVGGPRVLFAVVAALYFVAAGFALLLPKLEEPGLVVRRRPRSIRTALLGGWRTIRNDRPTYGAMVDDIMVGVGLSSLVVIVPFYLERVLETAKENTVFVFAPSALGLIVGLRLAPRLAAWIGAERAATVGLIGFAACIASLGFIGQVRAALEEVGISLDALSDRLSIPALVILAMLISIPAGLTSAIVSVAARSVLLDRTPATARGQVIATQALLNNLAGLVPTLLAGLAVDLFGVQPVAVAVGVLMTGGALAAHSVGRHPVPVPSPTT